MGDGAASIAPIAPEVSRQLPGLPEPADLSPADARFRFFAAVASFLRNAARRQPLVLVLDDLHWADTPSLLLLRFVARETRAARILIVGTARDAELPADHPAARTLAQVAREGQQLELRGLSAPDLARFIELLQGAQPAAQLVEAVHRRTDGNPFFAGEVVRLLTSEGESGATDGGPAIPLSVRQTIHHRLQRLSPAGVRILEIAAIIGAEFDLAVIEGVAALEEEPIADRARLLAALDECVSARLVAPRPRVPGAYRFTHALVRETLCDELGTAARAQRHRSIGEVLERLHADDPEPYLAELAHHFLAAAPVDERGRALAYAIRAAERSTRRLAYEDAAEHYQAALQLLARFPQATTAGASADGPPDTLRQRCELLIALGEARARAGETAPARDAFVAAAQLARGLGAVELLTDAALGLAGGADVNFRVDAPTLALLEEALAAGGATDSPARARLLSRLATCLYFADAGERPAALSRQAVEIAERLGNPVTLALVLHNAHFAVLGPDTLDERTAMASRIIALGETTGRKDLTFAGHYWRLVDALERGDIAVVDASQRRHAELAEQLGQPFYRWRVRVLAAMRALLAGRLADAERLIEEALQLGRRTTPNALLAYGVQLYGLRREQGRIGEMEPAIRAFAEEHTAIPAFRSGLALLCCDLGRLGEARAIFDDLAARRFEQFPRDANWTNAMDELAQVCAALGDRERAALLYERLAPYERHNVVIAFAEGCNGSVARYLGLLAATMQRWEDAARLFVDALAMNAALGAWPPLAHTQCDYAAMLRRAARRETRRAPRRCRRRRAPATPDWACPASPNRPPRVTSRSGDLQVAMASGRMARTSGRAGSQLFVC
jgi:tetratricopeptide (TPR) repeat protein